MAFQSDQVFWESLGVVNCIILKKKINNQYKYKKNEFRKIAMVVSFLSVVDTRNLPQLSDWASDQYTWRLLSLKLKNNNLH